MGGIIIFKTIEFKIKFPFFQQANGLPKTRSGKITRRILRKIAEGDKQADLGDISTLVDETIIEHLWENRLKEIRTTG